MERVDEGDNEGQRKIFESREAPQKIITHNKPFQ